ncbi:MAG: ABC transporter ATP-binding protein [Dissulfurispiraceae bacterium]
MNKNLIDIQDVDVSLNGQRILTDISWRLQPGEHWALIGANGSGKSTLLKLIKGDIWPDPKSNGKRVYHFNNKSQNTPLGIRQHIAFVSPERQDAYTRYNWDLSGQEVIYTGFFDSVWLYDQPKKAEIESVDNIIRMLKLEHLRDKSLLQMSEGEARKILIARALVGNPKVIILDECCSGVDVYTRRKILELIEEIAHKGIQVLFATHRVQELIPPITHVLFLKDGRITHQGKREKVFTGKHISEALNYSFLNDAIILSSANHAPRFTDPSENNKECMVKIRNADVYLQNKKILHGINWQMTRGENWAILGRNGAGKSTLLKLITGDVRPAFGGQVHRFGTDKRESIWETKKRIGFVSSELQANYAYNGTGEEVIESGFSSSIGLYAEVTAEQKKITRRWIRSFKLQQLIKKQMQQMSYGELRKILIARAMVNSPDILVLDEPCSGLDAAARMDFLTFIEGLSQRGTGIIFVTHRTEDLIPSITHIALMDNGGIIAQGERDSILKDDKYSALLTY